MTNAPKTNLVASCGIYCGACKKYTKGKCLGCAENEKATWCQVRTCTWENGYSTCADCRKYVNVHACIKFNNFFSKIFSFVFKSDRKSSLQHIAEVGAQQYAMEMHELGRPVHKRK